MDSEDIKKIIAGVLGILVLIGFIVMEIYLFELRLGHITIDPRAPAIDEIKDFEITADVNEDGSLDMRHRITWHIISDGDEGPLTWVKICIPDGNVDNMQAVSSNIEKIKYFKDNDGEYIRLDFNRSYTAGDEFTFEYTFTQYNLFTEEADSTYYEFTTGWFPRIPIDNMTIRWNTDKVVSVEPDAEIESGYYTWQKSLVKGQTNKVKITYDADAYNYTKHTVWHWLSILRLILEISAGVLSVAVVITAIITIKNSSRYISCSYGSHVHHHGGFGGGCACACACACAGGGRAGCSAKDFYGTKLESSRVRARLRQKARS